MSFSALNARIFSLVWLLRSLFESKMVKLELFIDLDQYN